MASEGKGAGAGIYKMNSRANGRMDLRSEKRKNDSRGQCFASKIKQEFLRSRVKRRRGAIGSRMDEPGPYLTTPSGRQDNSTSPDARVKEEWKRRVHGPEKLLFLR